MARSDSSSPHFVGSALIDRRELLVSLVLSWSASALPGQANGNPEPSGTSRTTPAPTHLEWRILLFTIFPHKHLAADVYDPSAAALITAGEKDAHVQGLLTAGWAQLRQSIPLAWTAATPNQRLAAVRAISGGPFFVLVRRTAAFTLYSNALLWKAFSYDGDAWRIGGWLGRPEFGVLDWLPEPSAPPTSR